MDAVDGFSFTVVARASRFAHSDCLHSDKSPHAMLGIARFPGADRAHMVGKWRRRFVQSTQPLAHQLLNQ
jgi:hypothetical protein